MQVVAANFGRLRGFADRDAFAFACFFKAFTDRLHAESVREKQGAGKAGSETRLRGRAGKREQESIAWPGSGPHIASRSLRISRGCAPFSGPTMPRSSMISMRRAAR